MLVVLDCEKKVNNLRHDSNVTLFLFDTNWKDTK